VKNKLKSFCLENSIKIYSNYFDKLAALNALFPISDSYSYDRDIEDGHSLYGRWGYTNLCPFEISVSKLKGRVWVGNSPGSLYLHPVDLEASTQMPIGSFRVILSRSLSKYGDDAYGRNYSPDMLNRDDFAETVIEDAQFLIDSVKSQKDFFLDYPEGAVDDYRNPYYVKFARVLQANLGWYWVYGKPEDV